MSVDKKTVKNWASRLSADDEMLTIPEAQLIVSIAQNDRLLEIRTALQDVQARLTRLELFVATTVPGYDQHIGGLVRRMLEAAPNGADCGCP